MSNLAVGDDGSGTKTNMLIPGVLTLTLCGVIGYHYGTQEYFDHAMVHFLILILLQMLPLLLLKLKIYQCGDRLSLVPRVLVKTMLMHTILAVLRIIPAFLGKEWNLWDVQVGLDVAFFIASVVILRNVFGYQVTMRTIIDEREVRNLCLMGIIAAGCTEVAVLAVPQGFLSVESTRAWIQDRNLLKKIAFTAANYVDVVAFVPVVLKLFEIERDDDSTIGTSVPQEARQQVLIFFGFVVSFYSWDDVIDPIRNGAMDVSMMAHAAHIVLLLDFAGFFIFQVWTPSSVKGEQLHGLLEQGFEQDD